MAQPLTVPPHPIGLLPQYTKHSQPIAIKIKEHVLSLSGDSFTIKDIGDNSIVKVDGKWISLHSKKTLRDANTDAELFTMKKKLLRIHQTYELVDASENVLAVLKGKWGISAKIDVTFKNLAGNGEEVVLKLKGDWFDRKAEITWDDKPIAYISRNFFNGRELIGDAQTYVVQIAPYVDVALIIAACVALDEKENED
ncbi:hypothetical protein BT69DRAFT_1248181 [Atractiella rhizophila]|nr:hypothetical protein BT69DRAFT_1248181 [Atractiella rhizophila]